MIEKIRFKDGTDASGIELFRLNNGSMTVDITNYGAAIVSIMTPDRNGKLSDIVLGFDEQKGYEQQDCYFGVVAGRYANRIAKGRFSLNGKEYQLDKNDGENHLHGGFEGFSKRVWTVEETTDSYLSLSIISEDMEGGYPGRVKATVSYYLFEDNRLFIRYSAVSSEDTILNLTNHSYFNLNGHDSGDILSHRLYINAMKFVRVDSECIPTGELPAVRHTPFCFISKRKMRVIGEHINKDDADLRCGGGYDHSFLLRKESKKPSHAATLLSSESGRRLDVYTNKPGLQLYTANMLKPTRGKANYDKHSGVCLETQFLPDTPNHEEFGSCVLRAGEEYNYVTIFAFSTCE